MRRIMPNKSATRRRIRWTNLPKQKMSNSQIVKELLKDWDPVKQKYERKMKVMNKLIRDIESETKVEELKYFYQKTKRESEALKKQEADAAAALAAQAAALATQAAETQGHQKTEELAQLEL